MCVANVPQQRYYNTSDTEFEVQSLKFRVQSLKFRVRSLGQDKRQKPKDKGWWLLNAKRLPAQSSVLCLLSSVLETRNFETLKTSDFQTSKLQTRNPKLRNPKPSHVPAAPQREEAAAHEQQQAAARLGNVVGGNPGHIWNRGYAGGPVGDVVAQGRIGSDL